jgi:hypothetical protein
MTKKALKSLNAIAGKPQTPVYIPREYIAEPFEDRQKRFWDQLKAACSTEPTQRLLDFYNWWTAPLQEAPNVMRCEAQETWSMKGRMATWRRNDKTQHGQNQTRIL